LAPSASAQLRPTPTPVGTVTPGGYSARPIAIPDFEPGGGQKYPEPIFAQTIARDLELSGFFRRPSNPEFVAQVHAKDLREGRINIADWSNLQVNYLVKGKYTIQGAKVTVEALTYDALDGRYIFGKRYPDHPVGDPRRLAHRIADDIFQRIVDESGIANTQIAFVRITGVEQGRQNKEIFIMDADGRNQRQLTRDRLTATPTWGARGTELYYMTYRDTNSDLAGIQVDSGYSWFIARWPGLNLSPDWGPRKERITLTLTRDGNPEIYMMSREGKSIKRLTYNPAIDSAPDWSPSEDQIVFTSDRSGTRQLYIMGDDGMNVRQLTNFGDYNDGAAWSPKGNRIAFSSRIRGIFQIFTISPTGEGLVQLTSGTHNSEEPCWSPNGWVIAYMSDRGGTKQIHTMFADGRPIAQLTNGRTDSSFPAWSPFFP
jgi:TolB protein